MTLLISCCTLLDVKLRSDSCPRPIVHEFSSNAQILNFNMCIHDFLSKLRYVYTLDMILVEYMFIMHINCIVAMCLQVFLSLRLAV